MFPVILQSMFCGSDGSGYFSLNASIVRVFNRWLFLNIDVLSEEALPPAVALFSLCSRVACLCLSVSLPQSRSSLTTSPPLPIWFPQHNKESPQFSSFLSVPFVYCFPKSCLCLLLLCVSLPLTLCLPLARVLFSLFPSPYLYPIVPSCLWLTVL